jgi:hypothetical protein
MSSERTFSDGYLDGWHSVNPGSNPAIPAHATQPGKSDYDHGFDLGRAAARSNG